MTIRRQEPRKQVSARQGSSLTPAQFHILLALTEGERHGYAIMQEVERRTEGIVELGPGTLYRSIKQLRARGFIVEIEGESHRSAGSERRRRAYRVTPEGRARITEEAQRLRTLVQWADDALALEGGRP